MSADAQDAGTARALAAGMSAQLARVHATWVRGGARLGWKIGFNDPRVQHRLGVDGPLVGCLDAERRLDDGQVCVLPAGVVPFVEAEIAVRIGRDVEPGAPEDVAASAIAAVAPAIEVVDYAEVVKDIDAILARSIFHFASVIGREQQPRQFRALTSDHPRLFKNGVHERNRDEALVLTALGAPVARVASVLGAHGERLQAGDWILTGSWVNPAPVARGDSVEVDFGPVGRVATRFETAPSAPS